MTSDISSLKGGIDKPELFFGIVSAVGTHSTSVISDLSAELTKQGYKTEQIRLSSLLRPFKLKNPYPLPGDSEYERIRKLIERADELRRITDAPEVLALMAASEVASRRPSKGDRNLPGRAFILNQFKNPQEIRWMRHLYGDAFHLIGLYSSVEDRRGFLQKVQKMDSSQIDDLILRDESSENDWGQQLRSTFHRSDVFIELREDSESTSYANEQVLRFIDLLFGRRIVTPSKDEFGMFLAYATALRSSDLSRQVGASILDVNKDVLALGVNEVPAAGGGQYWGERGEADHRDFQEGFDSNEVKRIEAIHELLSVYDPSWSMKTEPEKEKILAKLDGTRVANLTEFGRAVHAEMEALLSAARRGVSVRNSTLYTTTFPCHNCAKHIVGAGVREVIYIEPYPKSLAPDLHHDSITLSAVPSHDDRNVSDNPKALIRSNVRFRPFVGIAPRRYSSLFSSISEHGDRYARKEKGGKTSTKPTGLKLRPDVLSHIEREALAAFAAKKIGSKLAEQT